MAATSARRVSRSAALLISPGAIRGRSSAARTGRRAEQRSLGRRYAASRRQGFRHNTFKIDLARRASSAHSRKPRAARRSRSPTRRSREQPMAPYIGTATSRVDGIAKVTGAAKYAAEFNVPGLAYASVVTSTIAKGRITRIDTSAASGVKGVLDRPDARKSPAAWRTRTGLQGRCGPGRFAIPAALRRQDHVQRAADCAGGR